MLGKESVPLLVEQSQSEELLLCSEKSCDGIELEVAEGVWLL